MSGRALKLSDGAEWERVEVHGERWWMLMKGSTRGMHRHPFPFAVAGFTAADHRAIADVLDGAPAQQEVTDEMVEAALGAIGKRVVDGRPFWSGDEREAMRDALTAALSAATGGN